MKHYILPAVLLCMTLLAGCTGRKVDLSNVTESTIGVNGDGSVEEVVIESFDKEYYSLSDLTAYVNKQVDAFNQANPQEQPKDKKSDDEEITAVNNKQRPNRSHNIIRISKIENAIIEIIQENDNKGKQTDLGEIGSRLQKKYSDFDVRNYGYSSLSTFINEMDGFKTYKVNNAVLVKLKEDDNIKEQVVKYAIDNVRASKATGVELAILGQRIHSQYPKFKAKEYGYSTLTKFVSSIKELLIETTDNKRIVFIRKKES